MNSLQLLREQKAALEEEIARTIKAANEKKLALEAQIEKQRIQEILQGRAEIQKILAKYNLTMEEAISTAPPVVGKQGKDGSGGVPVKGSSYLSEIRTYYKNAAG
jgi:hypothetical protein